MRKTLAFCFSIFFALSSLGQTQVFFAGSVKDILNTPVPSVKVAFTQFDAAGVSFSDTTSTDASGLYTYVLNTSSSNDSVLITLMDCQGVLTEVVHYNAQQYTFTRNFNYCMGCNADFNIRLAGNMVICTPLYTPQGGVHAWSLNGSAFQFMDSLTFPVTDPFTEAIHTYALNSINCADTTTLEELPFEPFGGVFIEIDTPAAFLDYKLYLIRVEDTGQNTFYFAQDSGLNATLFDSLLPGRYLIKAVMANESDPNYEEFMPTYYKATNFDGRLLWSQATAVEVVANTTQNILFKVLNRTPPNPGSHSISGSVLQGTGKVQGPGQPLKQVLVLLFDQNTNPIAYTFSDGFGNFSFSNLSPGTYTLFSDIPGLVCFPLQVTINTSNPNETRPIVEVNSDEIVIYLNVHSSTQDEAQLLPSVFPNPFRDQLFLSSTNVYDRMVVRSMNGQIAYQSNKLSHEVVIDTSPWARGVYFIELTSNTGTEIHKLIKR